MNKFEKPYKLATLEESLKELKLKPDIEKNMNQVYQHFFNLNSSISELNKELLTNYVIYREVKNSSNIENIYTSSDTMYKEYVIHNFDSDAVKIRKASDALQEAIRLFKEEKEMSIGLLIEIQAKLISNEAEHGIRHQNVKIGNEKSEFFYRPPCHEDVDYLLKDWLEFFNKKSERPLIDMAIMHYQFESIHPFLDGNGRLGRILIYLYLMKQNILIYPTVSISKYIAKNKKVYYFSLQNGHVNENKNEAWNTLFRYFFSILANSLCDELEFNFKLDILKTNFDNKIKELSFYEKYSYQIIKATFYYPYTTIDHFGATLGISQPTAIKYLKELLDKKILVLEIDKNKHFYKNEDLFALLEKY